jgi:galactokinase
LATLTWRAENDFVGVPSGIMDQSASLLCQAGHALLLDCRSGETTAVPLDPAGAGLMLLIIDTGARHALGDGRYAQRRDECDRAAAALGASSLREVTGLAAVAGLADPVLRRRARHVITENGRVAETVALLTGGDLAGVGTVLSASHASLRDDFEVSWPEADVAVDAATAAGALGARMMGGGFGGSALALVPAGQRAVSAAVTAEFAGRGWPPPGFIQAVPSAGALRLR